MHNAEHIAHVLVFAAIALTVIPVVVVLGIVISIRTIMSQLDSIRAALDIQTQSVADNTAATNAAVTALGTSVQPLDPAEVDAVVSTIHASSNAIAASTAAIKTALAPKP